METFCNGALSIVFRIAAYVAFGLVMEIGFTAISALVDGKITEEDKRLRGVVSLYMIPVYGLLLLVMFEPAYALMSSWHMPWYVRYVVYAVLITAFLPTAYVFWAPMSESLFLALTLAFFYSCSRGHYALGALFGFLAALTGLDKGDFGIGAEGDSVGLAAEGVAESPPLAAFGRDFEIEPAPVIEDINLVLGLGVANSGIR